MEPHRKTVWTIGHSTRTMDDSIAMLQSFKIEMVADVRHYPGSRKFSQFNKEELCVSLSQNSIGYTHIVKLGGRRKASAETENTAWRHLAFRGYADYMETGTFAEGITLLEDIATKKRTAYMCSEAVWWRCHRSMISDYLKVNGWKIMHIMAIAKAEEHPYTAPTRIVDGTLTYKQ